MKKALAIGSIVLLTGAFLYACGIIPNRDTSFVTITIGDRPQQALLKAEAATPWRRMKNYLASVDLVPTAQAYIPSVVQVILVTVTAGDITTPIVGVKNVAPTDTSASLTIEVPNGAARTFLVEGYRGLPDGTTQLFYSGAAKADLSGTDVTLAVDMALVGPGILVDTLHSQATDTTGCGTSVMPCKTISFALSQTTGTDAIFVAPGTYPPAGAAAGELYPLQLKPNTALVCLGSVTGTIIDAYNGGDDAIYGDSGASVDNCTVIPDCDWIAIDDTVGGVNGGGQAARMRINGVVIGSSASCPAWDAVMLSADSTIVETTIQDAWSTYITVNSGKPVIRASTLVGTLNATDGIYIASGNPVIVDNTIAGMSGNGIAVLGGDATISANTIMNNSVGLNIQSSGTPIVSKTVFDNNGTGLLVSAGNAETSGNTFTNNNTGISITGGSPRIMTSEITGNNNVGIEVVAGAGDPEVSSCRIYCNYWINLSTSSTTTLRAMNNSWENAPPLVSNTLSGCNQGDDVCYDYLGPAPLTDPYGPAAMAPGTCNRPVGKTQRR